MQTPTDGLRPAVARIDALDALRGLAVLGIFVINILGFGLPMIAMSNPLVAGGDGAVNHGIWTFTTIFVEGSMRALRAAGRMALSNYVGQTVIANLIFSGIGLGLYGALDRVSIYTIMLLVLMAQLTFSLWWLGRFNYGPLEWVWRSLTYWHRPALRRTEAGNRG